MANKRSIKDDFNLMTILVIPIAIAINFICGNLALALKLPVYLDCIGTFLVAMLAGPWVGCLTGFLRQHRTNATIRIIQQVPNKNCG